MKPWQFYTLCAAENPASIGVRVATGRTGGGHGEEEGIENKDDTETGSEAKLDRYRLRQTLRPPGEERSVQNQMTSAGR
jgi:hypothetical protein